MIRVELIFEKLDNLDAGYVSKVINDNIDRIAYKLHPILESVTVSARHVVVIFDILEEINPFTLDGKHLIEIIGGAIAVLLDFKVRFRNFEIHGVTSSLVFKKEWRDVKVALCVIAKDEAPYVGDFVNRVAGFFDDFVVGVDTRTKDSTWDEFAKRGARCFYIDWENDFAKFRNKTMQFVAPEIEWVFWLDVDEKPDLELLLNLRGMIKTKYDSFTFRRINLVTKTEERVIRLFRRNKGYWEGRVHEVVIGVPEDRICHTDFKIYHYQRWIAQGGKIAEERNKFYRRLEALERGST